MRLGVLSLGILALCGCADPVLWYKNGNTLDQRDRDSLRCEVAATRDAPVALHTTQGAGQFIPATTSCSMETLGGLPRKEPCITTPARWAAGPTVTHDANTVLRGKVYRQCMTDLGYQKISLPRCANTQRTVTAKMGRLTHNSCAVPLANGIAISP